MKFLLLLLACFGLSLSFQRNCLPIVKLGSDLRLRAAHQYVLSLSDTAVQGFKLSSAFRREYLNLSLTKIYKNL